jgi:hypothetical protein
VGRLVAWSEFSAAWTLVSKPLPSSLCPCLRVAPWIVGISSLKSRWRLTPANGPPWGAPPPWLVSGGEGDCRWPFIRWWATQIQSGQPARSCLIVTIDQLVDDSDRGLVNHFASPILVPWIGIRWLECVPLYQNPCLIVGAGFRSYGSNGQIPFRCACFAHEPLANFKINPPSCAG